jgi:ribosomal protein L40E
MPKNPHSQVWPMIGYSARRYAQFADRTRGVMSTNSQVWVCKKCGTRNHENAERCAGCEKRR